MKDPYYASRFTFNPARRAVWEEIVRYESRFLPRDAVVLDLGAGYCDFINVVQAKKKYAIDISPELTQYANKEVITIQRPGWNYHEIPDASLDVVHASNFLEHFSDDELSEIMREIKRMLRPHGTLILMQPNYALAYRTYFDDYTHKKVFSHTSLE
jgi:SAM-dependent methyltransferase